MRIESSITALSWLPSDAVRGVRRLPFSIGVARYDAPPPDQLDDAKGLVAAGGARQANELRAWIEVEEGAITGAGYAGGGSSGEVEVEVSGESFRSSDVVLPILQRDPEIADGAARFVQSYGGRIGVPVPRRVAGLPLLRISAPVAWTTLALTIRADGSSEGTLVSASPFPRHWVYDDGGRLVSKSAEIDYRRWLSQASDSDTPWGAEDTPEFVVGAESELERELSREIMKSKPPILRLKAGQWLTEQGKKDRGAYLVLDGVFDVYVGGQEVGEVGPGSVVGERAELEGRRTATLQARTDCRVVRFGPSELDLDQLTELAERHQGEES